MNIIYLHGLASSGQSNTAKKLRELLPDDNVVTPDIPVCPIEALQLLLSLAGEYRTDDTIVVGTSMGAMYACQMKGYRRILVNPAFHVSGLLKENKGKQLQFFSKREDGHESFEVTESLIREFEEMEANLFYVDDMNPEGVIGLFGGADEVCDCRDEYREHYSYWSTFPGGHYSGNQLDEAPGPHFRQDFSAWFDSLMNGKPKYEIEKEYVSLSYIVTRLSISFGNGSIIT